MKNLFESIDDAIVDLKSGRRVKDGLQVVLLFLVLKVDAESDGIGLTMVDYNDVPREVRIPYDMLQKHNTPRNHIMTIFNELAVVI